MTTTYKLLTLQLVLKTIYYMDHLNNLLLNKLKNIARMVYKLKHKRGKHINF